MAAKSKYTLQVLWKRNTLPHPTYATWLYQVLAPFGTRFDPEFAAKHLSPPSGLKGLWTPVQIGVFNMEDLPQDEKTITV